MARKPAPGPLCGGGLGDQEWGQPARSASASFVLTRTWRLDDERGLNREIVILVS